MVLKDIKPVATLGDQQLYSEEQMQDHAKVERDYIIVKGGDFVAATYATTRFTGVVEVDIYGDQYKVLNHFQRGKKWVLQEVQHEEV